MTKVYVNIDINSANCPFLDKVLDNAANVSEADLYPFVDIYKRTQATDIIFNTFSQISISPSTCFGDLSGVFDCIEKNNIHDDFLESMRCYHTLNTKYNIEPFAIWIKRCRENGHNPWISIRMNDCHPFKFLLHEKLNSFKKTALANGWMLGEDYGYFRYCYNYRFEEVRNMFLAYIEEQLFMYDVFGIELDFMREIQCFQYLTDNMEECTEIMNSFMRDVKAIVNKAEKHYGHPIKILVRVMRDIEQTKFYGFDTQTWAKEELIDILNPTPRWTGGDSGIPIKEWKEFLSGIEIAPGVETVVNYEKSRHLGFASVEIARGLCASFLSQNSDGIYFYNYFLNPEEDNTYCNEHTIKAHGLARNLSVLSACRDFDTIYNYPIRFPLIPQADEGFAICPSLWQPLPSSFSLGEEKQLEITTGKIPEGKRAYLVLCADKDISKSQVLLNNISCNDFEDINFAFLPGVGSQPSNYVSEGIICKKCNIDINSLTDLTQNIKIIADNPIELVWSEIVVY